METVFDPIRLRHRPLAWHIYTRGGWYRAVPCFPMAEFGKVSSIRTREYFAGIRTERHPWVPGERAEGGATV